MTYPPDPEPGPEPGPVPELLPEPWYAPGAQVPVGTRTVTVETAWTKVAGLSKLRAKPNWLYFMVSSRAKVNRVKSFERQSS